MRDTQRGHGCGPWTLELLHGYTWISGTGTLATLLPYIFQSDVMRAAQALTLRNYTFGREESWVPMLRHLTSLRTLVLDGAPVAKMFWVLQEKPTSIPAPHTSASNDNDQRDLDVPVCPRLECVALLGIDCSVGRWLDMCHEPPTREGADICFIELVIAYLEGRERPLEVFEMKECLQFAATDIKLIQRPVNHVEWDRMGAFAAMNPKRAM
ncbi:hypothetical protein C8R44DRAFT_981689 [Mycena epipterygia]|nr:hypothetical protein C8R44DRAFT_981689 [Mycena epipterygia]